MPLTTLTSERLGFEPRQSKKWYTNREYSYSVGLKVSRIKSRNTFREILTQMWVWPEPPEKTLGFIILVQCPQAILSLVKPIGY
ncbi:hypothetical protein J6590_015165 [Homalodisca vitripennis]|nr:hypothetical protein J6590_015165 [Homalodisca vitripennis]